MDKPLPIEVTILVMAVFLGPTVIAVLWKSWKALMRLLIRREIISLRRTRLQLLSDRRVMRNIARAERAEAATAGERT